jgi:hypothetical protein
MKVHALMGGRIRSTRIGACLALVGVLTLAACAGGTGSTTGSTTGPGDNSVKSGKSAAAQHGVSTREWARIVAPNPDDILGKEQAHVRTLFGAPDLLRKETNVEVWQYAGETCVLFLFMYENGAGAPAVSYMDARGEGVTLNGCVADTYKAHFVQSELS